MKVLSVRQPWAWMIIRPDLQGEDRRSAQLTGAMKTIENRSWPTAYRGPLLIHAAKAMTKPEYLAAAGYLDALTRSAGIAPVSLPPMDQLQRGGIVGMACVVDCIAPPSRTVGAHSRSHWHIEGMYGWLLADACSLPFHELKGRLGLFEPPARYVADGWQKLFFQSGSN